MEYQVEDIVTDVKVALDENKSSVPLNDLLDEADVDTLKLDEIIESKIADGARLVIMAAPHWMLEGGSSLSEWVADNHPIVWNQATLAGSFRLPPDFLRLVVFQMDDWSRGITEAVSEDSADYLLQSSRWKGIRGNAERPVVAIVHDGNGMRLEFFCCLSTDTDIARGLYLPVPEVKNGKVDICPKLYRATVYRIASMTAAIIGASDVAAMLLGTSNELLTINGES